MKTPEHYNNDNGSLYAFCEKYKLNTYQFDTIKRIIRYDKKGTPIEDLKKTLLVLELMNMEHDGVKKDEYPSYYPIIMNDAFIKNLNLNEFQLNVILHIYVWDVDWRNTNRTFLDFAIEEINKEIEKLLIGGCTISTLNCQ